MLAAARRARGFSLLELVVVLLIIGVLASVAVPRMLRDDGPVAAGYTAQLTALIRYGQQVAVAERREICVSYNAGPPARFELRRTVAPATPGAACDPGQLIVLGDSDAYVAPVPASVAVTYAPLAGFRFNALDQASAAGNFTITGVTRYTLDVVAETGHVIRTP